MAEMDSTAEATRETWLVEGTPCENPFLGRTWRDTADRVSAGLQFLIDSPVSSEYDGFYEHGRELILQSMKNALQAQSGAAGVTAHPGATDRTER